MAKRVKSFHIGYAAFQRLTKNKKGYWNLPNNPYNPYSDDEFLAHREWEAGINAAYFDNLRRIEKCTP